MAAQALGQAAATFSQARGTFTCSGGVCVGESKEIIGVFAGLQRSINVLLALFNQGKSIVVDGQLGKETFDASGLVLVLIGRQGPSNIEWLASNAKRLANEFSTYAKGKPNFQQPSVTPATTTSTTTPTTTQLPEPLPPETLPAPGERKGLHWGWWVGGAALLAGAGYLGYRMFSGKGMFSGAMSDDVDDDHGYGEADTDFIDV